MQWYYILIPVILGVLILLGFHERWFKHLGRKTEKAEQVDTKINVAGGRKHLPAWLLLPGIIIAVIILMFGLLGWWDDFTWFQKF